MYQKYNYAFLTLIILLSPKNTLSAEWKVEGNVTQELSYNDNVRMTQQPEGSFKYKIVPVISLSSSHDNYNVNTKLSYGTQVYSDIDGLDQDLQNYSFDSNYAFSRNSFQLRANYSVQPARDDAEIDTGNFATNAERTNWSVAPSFSYQLTELDFLNVFGSYTQTLYSEGNFSNNDTASIGISWRRFWSPRLSSSININYSKFKSSGTLSTDSNVYLLNFSAYYDLSENWKIQGTIGARVVQSETLLLINNSIVTNNHTLAGWRIRDLGINYQGERFNTGVIFNRALEPSGNGTLNEQTSIALKTGYRFTENITSDVEFSYRLTESVSVDVPIERNNYFLRAGVSWLVTPEWQITASYRYRNQDFSINDQPVDSNTIIVTINYNWQGFSIAR